MPEVDVAGRAEHERKVAGAGPSDREVMTLAAFEDFFGGRLWLPAEERRFHHELSISVYHPSQPPDVLL